jgi:multidrug efflux pump subunit AcrB
MIAGFFIERPIFASVISIVLVLCGGVAAVTLPTTQYPDITPPTNWSATRSPRRSSSRSAAWKTPSR